MSALKTSILAALVLAGCSGKPFQSSSGGGDSSSNPSVATLPGTDKPTASSAIMRTEAQNVTNGNGYAKDFKYDAGANTFSVQNLGFDGGNVYAPDANAPALGTTKAFTASSTYTDGVTGDLINQFSYRALYGESKTGNSFAIVRTGAYVNYGFGGFVYNRASGNGAILPKSGQAIYAGDYAGLRDSDNSATLAYTTGKMTMAINFGASVTDGSNNSNGAVITGQVTNRQIFDLNGNNITAGVVAAINADRQPTIPLTEMPALLFDVGPGLMDNNGEMQGTLASSTKTGTTPTVLESGKYYGVLSGDATQGGKDEVVGVLVVNSTVGGVDSRETGGFILYRGN